MKTRNGFVSNSSTSSFIVLGYERGKDTTKMLLASKLLPTESEDGEKLSDEERLEIFYEQCQGDRDPFRLVSDEYDGGDYIGWDVGNSTAQEILESANEMKALLGTDVEPKIYGGAYAS